MSRKGFLNKKINFLVLSIILFFVLGIFNDSKYGATFSWILIPFIFIFLFRLKNNPLFEIKRMHLIILIFYLLSCFSTFLSPIVELQRDIVTEFLFLILFFLITSDIKLEKYFPIFIRVYFLLAFVVSFLLIYNWLDGNYYNKWQVRSSIIIGGVAKDPNYVSGFIAPAPVLCMCFYKKYWANKFENSLFVNCCYILLCVFAILCSGSRGSLLVFLVSFVMYVLFIAKGLKVKISIFGIVVFLCLIFSFFNLTKFERFFQRFSEMSNDSRLDIWKEGIKGFLNNPLIGQGNGAGSYYSQMAYEIDTHNMYIDIISSTGLIGFIVYCCFILNVCCISQTKYRMENLIITFAFLMPQFFINGINTTSQWIPILMVYFYTTYKKNEEIKKINNLKMALVNKDGK